MIDSVKHLQKQRDEKNLSNLDMAIALLSKLDAARFSNLLESLLAYRQTQPNAEKPSLIDLAEKAVIIWNEIMGVHRPDTLIKLPYGSLLNADLIEYFQSHSLSDFKAYCLRIARTHWLMKDDFHLSLSGCIKPSFLEKIKDRVIGLSPEMESDRPVQIDQIRLEEYEPIELILRFYIAMKLGVSTYKSWFEILSLEEGEWRGFSSTFHQNWIEKEYLTILTCVKELDGMLKRII